MVKYRAIDLPALLTSLSLERYADLFSFLQSKVSSATILNYILAWEYFCLLAAFLIFVMRCMCVLGRGLVFFQVGYIFSMKFMLNFNYNIFVLPFSSCCCFIACYCQLMVSDEIDSLCFPRKCFVLLLLVLASLPSFCRISDHANLGPVRNQTL